MRSRQVNAFRVYPTGITPSTLVYVQALAVCRACISVSFRAIALESTLRVNTFGPFGAGIVRAFIDVWSGDSWLIIQARSGDQGCIERLLV